jgi:HD-GYP domain-containing protein (c-di-GMP phosphodiesterase class II)
MSNMTLKHPVQTLNNEVLFPAGAALSPETVQDLVSSRGPVSYEVRPMLRYGSIRDDILELVGLFPYRRIFPTEKYVSDVVGEMEAVELAVPILQTIEYFKTKDFYTYRHILMVFALSTLIARDLIQERRDRLHLIATGPVHDVGKICVPLDVLKKTTPLTRNELEVMQSHAAAGHVLLSYYLGDTGDLAARVARDHHERRDGSGYPRGINLDDPMVEIIAACDVYDALIAPRPYRPMPYDNRTALEELTTMADKGALGSDIVKSLVTHNRRTIAPYCESMFSSDKRGMPPPGNVHGIIVEDNDTGTFKSPEDM